MLFGYYIYDEGAKKLNKFINKLSLILLFVAGIAIVAMTLIMSLDVVARYALKTGIPDTIEISSMLLGAVITLSLAAVTGRGEHIRFSMLSDNFSGRKQLFSKMLTQMIVLVMFGLMTWHATIRGIDNFKSGEYIGSLQIPIWPFRMMFAFGCLLTFLVVVTKLVSYFTHKADTEGV